MRSTTMHGTTSGGRRPGRAIGLIAAVALVLSGCGDDGDAADDAGTDATGADEATETVGDESAAGESEAATEAATDEATSDEATDDGADDDSGDTGGAPVTTAETDLGTILVTADGQTLYGFTQDEQGVSSACTEGCLGTWPALLADGEEVPDGLDDDVFGVITRDDGDVQLTAGGWPLYTYAPDAAGDTTGQGVGDVWWVVTPDGTLITDGA